jgi:type II secretory pathway component PulM
MLNRLRQWLSGLSPRETGLLVVLGGVALPVAVVFAVVLPVLEAHAAAGRAAALARADLDWLRGQLAAADRAGLLAMAAPAVAPVSDRATGLAALERSLVDAGLRQQVGFIGNAEGNGVRIEFEQVGFAAFMDWLGETEARFAYDIGALRIERGAGPGMVMAAVVLVAAP